MESSFPARRMLLVCGDLHPGTIAIAIPSGTSSRAKARTLRRGSRWRRFSVCLGHSSVSAAAASGGGYNARLAWVPEELREQLAVYADHLAVVRKAVRCTHGRRAARFQEILNKSCFFVNRKIEPYEVWRGTLDPLMHTSIAAARTSKTAARLRLKKQRSVARKKANWHQLPSDGSRGSRLSV